MNSILTTIIKCFAQNKTNENFIWVIRNSENIIRPVQSFFEAMRLIHSRSRNQNPKNIQICLMCSSFELETLIMFGIKDVKTLSSNIFTYTRYFTQVKRSGYIMISKGHWYSCGSLKDSVFHKAVLIDHYRRTL